MRVWPTSEAFLPNRGEASYKGEKEACAKVLPLETVRGRRKAALTAAGGSLQPLDPPACVLGLRIKSQLRSPCLRGHEQTA